MNLIANLNQLKGWYQNGDEKVNDFFLFFCGFGKTNTSC